MPSTRRYLLAFAVFAFAMLLFGVVRRCSSDYGVLDLLNGKSPPKEAFTPPSAPKLSSSDVAGLAALDDEYAKLSAVVLASTVSVHTVSLQDSYTNLGPFLFYQGQKPQQGLGSGAIISKEGHVITNHHVIAGSDQVKVTTQDGKTYNATIIGSSQQRDIALIKIDTGKDEKKEFPALTFGDSDKVRVGQIVFAVGNPFGLTGTVTQGIISARDRIISDNRDKNDYLQTDAVINHGNSGGPLVNIRGEIIGINVALFRGDQKVDSWQGISLAVPGNEAKRVIDSVLELSKGRAAKGDDSPGYMGWTLSPQPAQIVAGQGAGSVGIIVQEVYAASPALAAGLQPGDVILSFNGKRTTDPQELLDVAAGVKPGKPFALQVWRNGLIAEARGVVGKQPTLGK